MDEEMLIQDLKTIQKPTVEPTSEPKYRKVYIKNNRGPWKIANMLLKRSSQLNLISDNKTESSKEEKLDNRVVLMKGDKRDGFLVNTRVINGSSAASSATTGDRQPSQAMKVTETIIPLLTDTLIEQKFLKNLPKINLLSKTVDKKNLRNFKFNSDIDVIDLMEEDSVPARQHSDGKHESSTDDKLTLASDIRRARSPGHQISPEEGGDRKDWGPIKIFVFLNRNRNRKIEKTDNWKTDASNNWYNIAPKPNLPNNAYEVVADSSTSSHTSSTTTPKPSSTTTTTASSTTTTQNPIRRMLKKFDLDEFEDTIAEEAIRDMEEKEKEDNHYIEPSTTADTFTLPSVPISRNWTFTCGKKKGFFADVDNDCRTYYQCSVRGRQRWECPPGTRFNQFSSTCDWLENVDCQAFKDLINEKVAVEQHIDRTTTASPTTTEIVDTSSTTTTRTTLYEPDEYDDRWE